MGGLTIHQVLPSIDTGDIVFAHEFIFPNECRIPIDYMKHVESEEREFLLHFLNMLEQGQELKLIPQQEDHASYWPILNTTMNGSVDWDWNVDEIEIFINAFDDPYKGAFTFYENRKIHLKKCFKNDQAETFHPFQAGIIFRIHNETLYIAAVGGCIAVKDVFDEKGNRINNQIRIGYRLHTPYSHLESAKKDKARYGSRGLQSSKRAIRRE
jgi:methionyl-tRNA formyltransferase